MCSHFIYTVFFCFIWKHKNTVCFFCLYFLYSDILLVFRQYWKTLSNIWHLRGVNVCMQLFFNNGLLYPPYAHHRQGTRGYSLKFPVFVCTCFVHRLIRLPVQVLCYVSRNCFVAVDVSGLLLMVPIIGMILIFHVLRLWIIPWLWLIKFRFSLIDGIWIHLPTVVQVVKYLCHITGFSHEYTFPVFITAARHDWSGLHFPSATSVP